MNKAQQSRYESLYRRHVNALKRQGKSDKTIDVYARAVRRVTAYFDRCPDRLTKADFERYFTDLVQSHSWSTVKVDRNGLQFFYQHVLNRKWAWVDIVKPPRVQSLPDILTQAEIARIINASRAGCYSAFIYVVYTTGLRLSEALNLTVGDIDGERMRLHVRCGKGRKDRFVTLPAASLRVLRRHWTTHRHPKLIFPAGQTADERRKARAPMSRATVQKAFKAIVQSCGIKKQVSPHSLRHCYGTHLVEAGLNLRAIQQEMGHECPTTTARYTQLTDVTQQNSRALINAMVEQLDAACHGEG